MPWKVEKKGSRFAVVKKGTGQVVAMHPDMASAQAQVRAMYANYDKGNTVDGMTPPKKNNTARQKRLQSAAKRRASKGTSKNGGSSSGASGGMMGPAMNNSKFSNFGR